MMCSNTNDDWLRTRRTLLSRCRNPEDFKAWQEFCDLYGRLIYRSALRAGLNHEDAQDVAVETLDLVARKMPGFTYDPVLGKFRNWLRQITRRRIAKHFGQQQSDRRALADLAAIGCSSSASGPSWLFGGPKDEFEQLWETEWEQNLCAAALGRLKRRVKPKQYQIYDLCVAKQWPVSEVARTLNVSTAMIYVVKHRVTALLRREIERLRRQND